VLLAAGHDQRHEDRLLDYEHHQEHKSRDDKAREQECQAGGHEQGPDPEVEPKAERLLA
jgi:hypothetical protein